MISEKLVLKVNSISKYFHIIPDDETPRATGGWGVLLKSLFQSGKRLYDVKCFNALNDISFSVKKGESLGIIGLNGSGKSTLLQIISGTMQPSKGSVYLNGKVAALLELGSGFNPEFTGLENIKLSASLHGLGKREIRSKLDSIIEFADIGDFIHQPIKTYSSGMSLRLAFAVAAHIDSEILIIDEALAVGDARFQIKCFSFLEEFNEKGGSLILVSHDLNSIARLCQSSILMHRGRLVKFGKSINVINEYSRIISEKHNDNLHELTDIKEEGNALEKNIQTTTTETEMLAYGSELGVINNVLINGSKEPIITSGDTFHVTFDVESKSVIEEPIFALRIRDVKGQEIYGTNSKFLKIETPSLKEGDIYKVKFTQSANLGSGEYFLSIGFTFYKNHELKIVHRLRECNRFKVISKDGSFGISNCFSKIIIQKILNNSQGICSN